MAWPLRGGGGKGRAPKKKEYFCGFPYIPYILNFVIFAGNKYCKFDFREIMDLYLQIETEPGSEKTGPEIFQKTDPDPTQISGSTATRTCWFELTGNRNYIVDLP